MYILHQNYLQQFVQCGHWRHYCADYCDTQWWLLCFYRRWSHREWLHHRCPHQCDSHQGSSSQAKDEILGLTTILLCPKLGLEPMSWVRHAYIEVQHFSMLRSLQYLSVCGSFRKGVGSSVCRLFCETDWLRRLDSEYIRWKTLNVTMGCDYDYIV